MKYYQHHIGDFDKNTRHLSRIERSIYRDLIELYYDTERPLTLDRAVLCRKILARSNEEATAVEQTLNEFFTETPTGWYHGRCESEIERYHDAKKNHWAAKLTKSERAAIQSMRNASKANATPKWLTRKDRQEIAAVYALAATLTASTGMRHEVDHIIPLRSKLVCGLHVRGNIDVITAEKNRSKTNFFEVA